MRGASIEYVDDTSARIPLVDKIHEKVFPMEEYATRGKMLACVSGRKARLVKRVRVRDGTGGLTLNGEHNCMSSDAGLERWRAFVGWSYTIMHKPKHSERARTMMKTQTGAHIREMWS